MFKAFENDTVSRAIHDLTIENGENCINVYGNLQITKDQAGLKAAQALQTLLNEMVEALQKEQNLPEKITIQNAKEIENPFL